MRAFGLLILLFVPIAKSWAVPPSKIPFCAVTLGGPVFDTLPVPGSAARNAMVADIRRHLLTPGGRGFAKINLQPFLNWDRIKVWIDMLPSDYSLDTKRIAQGQVPEAMGLITIELNRWIHNLMLDSLGPMHIGGFDSAIFQYRNTVNGPMQLPARNYHQDGGRINLTLALRGKGVQYIFRSLDPKYSPQKVRHLTPELQSRLELEASATAEPGEIVVFLGRPYHEYVSGVPALIHRTPPGLFKPRLLLHQQYR